MTFFFVLQIDQKLIICLLSANETTLSTSAGTTMTTLLPITTATDFPHSKYTNHKYCKVAITKEINFLSKGHGTYGSKIPFISNLRTPEFMVAQFLVTQFFKDA